MFVLPAAGLKVWDPTRKRHLPAEGSEVSETTYWVRRLRAGDVVLYLPAMVQADQIPDSEPESELSEDTETEEIDP